jgi:hypothetical protein
MSMGGGELSKHCLDYGLRAKIMVCGQADMGWSITHSRTAASWRMGVLYACVCVAWD